ncbi:unnamed protein product, partial [Ectocarpus sp. 8 AP-2014]
DPDGRQAADQGSAGVLRDAAQDVRVRRDAGVPKAPRRLPSRPLEGRGLVRVRGEHSDDVLQPSTETAVHAGQHHGHAGRDAQVNRTYL